MDYQYINLLQETRGTFKAFVEAIIPRTPELAIEYGEIQYYGALDLHTDEYLILSINEFNSSLVNSTAQMLDAAAKELYINSIREVTFSSLSLSDRLMAISLLRQNQIFSSKLPIPFKNNIFNVIDNLIKLTIMGYYSEWFGYGTTRLNEPNQRRLEFYPVSWKQVGYPGPTPGYRFSSY